MKADDELCLCFHVSVRKVINFIRLHPIQQASQVSECYGAGTGCGWCRRQITRLLNDLREHPPENNDLDAWLASRSPSAKAHAEGRAVYRAEKEDPSK